MPPNRTDDTVGESGVRSTAIAAGMVMLTTSPLFQVRLSVMYVPGVAVIVCTAPLIVSCQPGCTHDGTRILIGSAAAPPVVVTVSLVLSCSGNCVSWRTVTRISGQLTVDAMNRFTYSVSAERK